MSLCLVSVINLLEEEVLSLELLFIIGLRIFLINIDRNYCLFKLLFFLLLLLLVRVSLSILIIINIKNIFLNRCKLNQILQLMLVVNLFYFINICSNYFFH